MVGIDMTVIAMPRKTAMPREGQQVDQSAEYRHRMLVNALAASFIGLLMISGYWVVSTLAG
jgi:hypothetical protein